VVTGHEEKTEGNSQNGTEWPVNHYALPDGRATAPEVATRGTAVRGQVTQKRLWSAMAGGI
jgi:hypothetical protein